MADHSQGAWGSVLESEVASVRPVGWRDALAEWEPSTPRGMYGMGGLEKQLSCTLSLGPEGCQELSQRLLLCRC